MAGISACNRDVFSDADFAPPYDMDCPALKFNAAIDSRISITMSDYPSTSGSFVIPSFSRLLPVALELSPGVVKTSTKNRT